MTLPRSDAGQNIVMRHENIVSAGPPKALTAGTPGGGDASPHCSPPGSPIETHGFDSLGASRKPGEFVHSGSPGDLSPAFLGAQAMACFRLANVALADRDFAEAGRLHARSQQFRLAALRVEGSA